MKHITFIFAISAIGILLIVFPPDSGQGRDPELKGRRADGAIIDLLKVLEEHNKWVKSGFGQEGRQAKLISADLSGNDLSKANLRGADLRQANLSRTKLHGADLSEAKLSKADLRGADLSGADLSEANLREANLSGTTLSGAILTEASAEFTDFSESWFEPKNIEGFVFVGAKGLSTIKFNNFKAVVDLRKTAKESGLRSEERAVTAALRKYRLKAARLHERIFEYILLDLPTDSGANPWRSLWVLGFSIAIFSIPYMTTVRRQGEDGIWRVWIPERVRKDLGEEKPMRLTLRGLAVLRAGVYFSVLSAFSIGWRELNVGNWIVRIQRREYTLRASGWTRTISGIQSLVSVYLLALWVLTYFGRPFE